MKTFKKITALVILAFVLATNVLALAACTKKSSDKYVIGIIQLLRHDALDAATDGFKAALTEKLGDKVEFIFKDGQADMTNMQSIANQFVQQKVDLIMANATNAVRAAKGATDKIPIVGTSVTDYVGAKLVKSNEKPGGNITGASDNNPVTVQVELMKKLCPDVKVVGIVYNSAEENSKIQADEAKAAFEAEGFTVKTYTVSGTETIQATFTQACAEVDGFYLPTDNLLADNMGLVKIVTTDKKKPVICAEENMVKNGGLASYSISYYDLGYQAGLMAYDILVNGKNPADMPIFHFTTENLTLIINEEVAEKIGVTIPEELKK